MRQSEVRARYLGTVEFDEGGSEIDINLTARWADTNSESPFEVWIDACAAWGDTQKVWEVSGQALPSEEPRDGVVYSTAQVSCVHKYNRRGRPYGTRLVLHVTSWDPSTGAIAVKGRWEDGADVHSFAGDLSLRARSE
jgi:hypothetical protein